MTDNFDFDELFRTLPNKQLLSLFEVASFLGITKRTVYNLYPETLTGTNLGCGIKIYRTSVVDYVKRNHCRKATDEDSRSIEKQIEVKKPSSRRSSWVKNY